MSKRHRNDKNRRFSAADKESNVILDTSIGSDGERSDNDYEAEDLTPSTTPMSVSERKLTNGRSDRLVFNLKFSIENILRPDFGRQTRNCIGSGSSDTSVSPPTYPDMPSPLASPHCVTPGQQQSNAGRNFSSVFSTVGTAANAANATPAPATTPSLWPAWVYCTRYSDRPSSGPRCRRVKRSKPKQDEKRPRTAFTTEQLSRLKAEFQQNRYLTEKRRQDLARDLGLNESQIKIWFQNKRAKIKKQTGNRNMLALHLMAQGLYNHATIPVIAEGLSPNRDDDDDDDDGDGDGDGDIDHCDRETSSSEKCDSTK